MANEQTQVAKPEPTYSQRFSSMVVKEFGTQVGTLELSPYQQILAKHLFIGIDKALTDLEAKRVKDGKNDMAPIVWSNVNMQKLALDAVHRVELGLDALIPNHIHTYFNKKLKKYDLDLAVGYVGKDYYKREMAVEPPVNIIYQLVHETDTFKPRMRSATNDIESYEFEINNPFKRGPVIGGFGYIIYKDITQNKLVLVSLDSMNKSKGLAKTNTFWNAHEANMQMVVVVRRVTAELKVDPKKVNASFMAVELDDNSAEIGMLANQDVIDIEAEPENEQKPQGSESTWNPCTSEIQQRYGGDKAAIIKNECEKRGIAIGGMLAREAHEKLLEEVSKVPAEAQSQEEDAGQKVNGKGYVHCTKRKNEPRIDIEICQETCDEFKTCTIAQNKINEMMAAEQAATVTEGAAAAGGPSF